MEGDENRQPETTENREKEETEKGRKKSQLHKTKKILDTYKGYNLMIKINEDNERKINARETEIMQKREDWRTNKKKERRNEKLG